MSLVGTVKSYNPHKGWGFVECNGQDMFLNRKELKGYSVTKGNQVQFSVAQGDKGPYATEVTVMVPPEEITYFGEIKRFNPVRGYGFISCEAFTGQDVFLLKSELPGGFGPEGGHCRFKVSKEEKGPAAKGVQLLGAAGDQAQQMKSMMSWGWGGFGRWGSGGKGKGRSADKTCWDFKKTGTCPRGAECRYSHEAAAA